MWKPGPEEQAQTAFFDFCALMASAHPAYALAYHVPNERKASIQRRVALKRAGVRKGVPDIVVPVPCGSFAALYIELKIKPNKPSPEQLDLISRLNQAGNFATVAWSADEAIELMKLYVSGKLTREPIRSSIPA